MIEAICGFVAASVIFTFFPTLGLKLSAWVRAGWEWVKRVTGIGPAKLP